MLLLLRSNYHRRHLKSFHESRSILNTLPLMHSLEHLPCCLRARLLCTDSAADHYPDFVVPQRQVAEPSRWKKVNASQWGITCEMIPPSPWKILKILRVRGFDSYLVGGCVRDLLLNREPKDFDIITNAKLVQVKKEFRGAIIIGQRFPICRVLVKGTAIEVSSFETVSRHAEEKENVIFSKMSGCDKKDFIRWRDSMHRDFTINSLFYDPFKNVIYDYSNGIADLKTLKLRTLIPAKLSFQEDCARILRGVRIAGRLGLTISEETATAMHEYSSSVSNLGKFRMMMEMNYMLSYGAANNTISLLQRFHLLDKILPFHAAYLDEQAVERSTTSCMMMLFSSLDQLFSPGRPCPPALWVGILAFHQALVANPQDGLAIWTFASVLYHGSWKKGIRFARENAKVQVAPEISGFYDGQSDEELAKEVTQLACYVQDSVCALMDAEPLSKYLSMFAVSPSSSCTVFIPRAIGKKATELFGVLLSDAEVQKNERLSFDLDYKLLVQGDVHETGFALSKVILETLGSANLEGMEVSGIEQEFAEEEVPRKKHVIIEKKVPLVLKEQDIGEKESEILIKGQAFEKFLKEEQEIEANGYSKLSVFVKCLVTVKDRILASLRGQHANGDGEREVADDKGYTTSQSEVKIKDEKRFGQLVDAVKADKSIDCGVVKEDRKQMLVKMEDSEHLLQLEKKEDQTLQHESSREKTDQFKAALKVDKLIKKLRNKETLPKKLNILQLEKKEDYKLQHESSREKTDQLKEASKVDKVIKKLGNKRTLESARGPKPKKSKGQKLSKLETCELQCKQGTDLKELVAVLKNSSPKVAENKMQLSDVIVPANGASSRTEVAFSKKMKLHSTVKADTQDSDRKSTKKKEKVKREAVKTLSMEDLTGQEELVVCSLSEKKQAQARKLVKEVEKRKSRDVKTVECATSSGKKKLNEDDRVKKDKHSLRQKVVRSKTEKRKGPTLSFVEEEGDDTVSVSSHSPSPPPSLEDAEMVKEKKKIDLGLKSKKAQVPLSALFRR